MAMVEMPVPERLTDCGLPAALSVRASAAERLPAAKGVKVKYTETPGAHWHIVWRRNLRDFAPLLFR